MAGSMRRQKQCWWFWARAPGLTTFAPVGGFAGVDVDDADDAGCARLDVDAAGLVEFEGEDVFVVGERDDELDHELAAASHDCAPGSPVGVLPVDCRCLVRGCR